jgi:hypothetical protein
LLPLRLLLCLLLSTGCSWLNLTVLFLLHLLLQGCLSCLNFLLLLPLLLLRLLMLYWCPRGLCRQHTRGG